jgi:soluble lytic murein transglycosylase-like protein
MPGRCLRLTSRLGCTISAVFLIFSTTGIVFGQEIIKVQTPQGRRMYSNTEEVYRLLPKNADKKISPLLLAAKDDIEPSPKLKELIHKVSEQHGVDPELVQAVAKAESNFNPYAVSSRGALGVMQLIPETAKRFGVVNAFDAEQNIQGGVKFLKFLLGMFPDNLPHVLAAYNAGENAVVKYNGIPPYPETQDYVKRITKLYKKRSNFLIASNSLPGESDKKIISYRDDSGRTIFSNLESGNR